MSVLNSLLSAFLMYSRIPVPQVEWKEENRRYALCFFPLIGTVTGGILVLWYMLCEFLSVNDFLFAAGCTLIPIAVTGGIHLDGFCDVNDALASCGSREKMLEIMSDPHIGAFGVIRLCIYILIQTALYSQARQGELIALCAVSFICSRAWSGLAAVTFPNAKGGGSLQSFSKPAYKKITITAEIAFLLGSLALMIAVGAFKGMICFFAGAAVFIYYCIFSKKKFGGTTGDLAGWFLQLAEIVILAAAVFTELFERVIL